MIGEYMCLHSIFHKSVWQKSTEMTAGIALSNRLTMRCRCAVIVLGFQNLRWYRSNIRTHIRRSECGCNKFANFYFAAAIDRLLLQAYDWKMNEMESERERERLREQIAYAWTVSLITCANISSFLLLFLLKRELPALDLQSTFSPCGPCRWKWWVYYAHIY